MGDIVRGRPARLREIAAAELPPEVAARADASDVVQQTLAEAHGSLVTFEGDSYFELVGWLAGVARNNARDFVRGHLLSDKRSVRKESRLNDSSGGGWNSVCAADQTSPSMAVERHEGLLMLREALERLPPRQRDAVRMRHLERRPLSEISAALDCTPNAAAQLVGAG